MVEITTPDPLPPGTAGQPYHLQLQAADGTPPYSWSIASGELPYGLTLDNGGLISGTPQAEAILSSVQIGVQDTWWPVPQSAWKWLTIVIRPAGQLVITTTQLPPAQQNTRYGAVLAATGGVPPYVWSIDSGTLPAGIQLDTTTGTLAGTPAAPSSSPCEFGVTDGAGSHATRMLTLSVVGGFEVTTTQLPAAMVQRPYDVTLQASGGVPPYRWAVATGALPDGIHLDAATGRLYGTGEIPGSYPLSFTVTDSQQSHATSETLALVVIPTACLAKINSFTIHTEVVIPDVRDRVTVSWRTANAAVVSFDTGVGQFVNPGPSGMVSIEYRDSIVGPIDPPVTPNTITCVDQYGLSISAGITVV